MARKSFQTALRSISLFIADGNDRKARRSGLFVERRVRLDDETGRKPRFDKLARQEKSLPLSASPFAAGVNLKKAQSLSPFFQISRSLAYRIKME